jgi:alkaline phosphatase D
MSNLRFPGLGPIVGHTTASTCRIWIRADDPLDKGADLAAPRRTLGVIAVDEEDGTPVNAPAVYYFRLHREFDRTGTFNLGEEIGIARNWAPDKQAKLSLKAGTKYKVVVGTLTLDDPFPDDENVPDDELAARLPESSVWREDLRKLRDRDEDRCTATFTTFPDTGNDTAETMSFIVGSCRYPGLLWKTKEADRIFGPLCSEALGLVEGADGAPRRPAEFVIMVGDQIYADMLNRHVPIKLADTFEEFQERYLTAFGSPNMKTLLSRVPTYMILDDHEIEDNWTQDRVRKMESRRVFNLAIGAYMSYQWSHGPRTYGRRLYYKLECGGYPFFVLDARTQRYVDDVENSLDDNHLLGRPALPGEDPGQLDLLLHWLKELQSNRGNIPKFIVTSSVFAPNPMSARTGRKGKNAQKVAWMEDSDSWPAFPKTRGAILECILENKVQNVVFLSGDIHCSNVAEISFDGTAAARKLKAFSITSSAFYWPFPFADGEPSHYVHDSAHPDQLDSFKFAGKYEMNYKAWNFTQEDNYCRVDVDRPNAELRVRTFDNKGRLIVRKNWLTGQETPLETDLRLADW